jgi:Raf kinase inhibitor-like YbhB/YbcL family protein
MDFPSNRKSQGEASERKMYRRNSGLWFSLVCWITALTAAQAAFADSPNLSIHSPDFAANERIPVTYTCSGDNKSPELAWSGVPASTKTLALVVRDPDAPMGSYVHWVVFNLPASVSGLPAAVPTTPTIVGGGEQGFNGRGVSGYQGPCPPPGRVHHYHFKLYALDTSLNLPASATAVQVEQAVTGHVIASGELVGTFSR